MAAPAFVKNVGSFQSSAMTGSDVLATVPAGGVAKGNTVFARYTSAAAANTPSSVTDSKSNTYTLLSSTSGVNGMVYLYGATITTALVSADTITVTYTATVSAVRAGGVDEFSGIPPLVEDTADTPTTGSSTTPSASITPTQAATLLVGHVGTNGGTTGDTYTQDADATGGDTWHALTRAGNGTVTCVSNAAYKITTSAAAQTYNPTITSRPWAENLVAIRLGTGLSFMPPRLRPALMRRW